MPPAPMIYLPTRVTPEQHARLVALRASGGVTISEHVRLALDPYLDKLERKARQSQPEETAGNGAAAAPIGAQVPPARVKPVSAVAARPKTPAPVIGRQRMLRMK